MDTVPLISVAVPTAVHAAPLVASEPEVEAGAELIVEPSKIVIMLHVPLASLTVSVYTADAEEAQVPEVEAVAL
jgi:hypothetical protein